MQVTALVGVERLRAVRPYLGLLRLLWDTRHEYEGVTYQGINVSLGFSPRPQGQPTHGRWLAKQAEKSGWVAVQKTGFGGRTKAVVRLTVEGVQLCVHLFEGGAPHG